MAITKAKKVDLVKQYVQDLQDAKNAVIVRQSAIPVSKATEIRKDVSSQDGKLNVVRKKLFLRALKDAGMEDIGPDQLEGPIFALYVKENEYGPLKVINKYLKEFAAANKGSKLNFVGGWFEKKRQSAEYVNELANIPSQEELYAKLCYLFNYPLQSFACVLSEVAKKEPTEVIASEAKQSSEVKEETKAEKKVEEKAEEKIEEKKEEKKEEAPKEEPKAE